MFPLNQETQILPFTIDVATCLRLVEKLENSFPNAQQAEVKYIGKNYSIKLFKYGRSRQ